MDKLTLTPEQLKDLRYFILKRGFKDPVIQTEILDHFACKVEEQLSRNPVMDIQEAMEKAHHEFGYNGFYSIQATVEKALRARYRKIYWRQVKNILTSPLWMLLIVLICYVCYKSVVWAFVNHAQLIWEQNTAGFLLWLTALVMLIIKTIILRPQKNNVFFGMANWISVGSFVTICPFIPGTNPKTEKGMILDAAIFTFLFAIFLVDYISDIKMWKAAINDFEEFRLMAE